MTSEGDIMNANQFVEKAISIANHRKTVYMWGTFGAPVSAELIKQKSKQYPRYYTNQKQQVLNQLVGNGYFAFDCVGLIKGLLWGWKGDSSKANGGAKYATGAPDINANQMIEMCKNVRLLFDDINPGEVVWMQGHIGIYIGDGKVVEATPSWNNGVQITSLDNIRHIPGMVGRVWTKHGKLPWISYDQKTDVEKLIDDMINCGLITSPNYWIEVLNKEKTANPDYVRVVFENAVKQIKK